MESKIMNYQAIITDIKDIISSGQKIAYNATNKAMILTYWHVGKRIVGTTSRKRTHKIDKF